jgi:hypothetical protein
VQADTLRGLPGRALHQVSDSSALTVRARTTSEHKCLGGAMKCLVRNSVLLRSQACCVSNTCVMRADSDAKRLGIGRQRGSGCHWRCDCHIEVMRSLSAVHDVTARFAWKMLLIRCLRARQCLAEIMLEFIIPDAPITSYTMDPDQYRVFWQNRLGRIARW